MGQVSAGNTEMNKNHAALNSMLSGREDRLVIKSLTFNAMGTTLKTCQDSDKKGSSINCLGSLEDWLAKESAVTIPDGLVLSDDDKAGSSSEMD